MTSSGSAEEFTASRRANVVGVGLIGGSLGMALREKGWHVSGVDPDENRLKLALDIGAIDALGWDDKATVSFVATPVGQVPKMVSKALDIVSDGVVTDVGGVKSLIVETVADPRFVGGHPMAGSEQDGLEGADSKMFVDANWVLTPSDRTDDEAFALIRSVVVSLGAEVITLSPERHDALVALVSHVPHLTAASLMGIATARSEEHFAVLRLAAGGFRDMTRIAAGHPDIWLDVCAENREAIAEVLSELIETLGTVRDEVVNTDKAGLLRRLELARSARISLPTGAPRPSELVEVRVPVLDRRGEIAAIASLSTDLDVNIYDLEIAHSAEGDRGVIVLVVEASLAERLSGGLMAHGYRPTLRPLT